MPQKSRAEVQAELASYKAGGVNPWSTQYNPLNAFRSSTTRQAATAEYIAHRDQVAAIGSEDGGSTALATLPRQFRVSDTLAGTPVNAK